MNFITYCLIIGMSIFQSHLAVHANNQIITGTVLDNAGVPIIGAQVTALCENGVQTVTEGHGRFSVEVNHLPCEIEVKYQGYKTQKIKIKSIDTDLKIVLKTIQKSLDEVHVSGAKTDRAQRENRSPSQKMEINAFDNYSNWHPRPIETRESYSKTKENKFIQSLDEGLSTFSIDVDRAGYSNVRRFLQNGQLPPKEAIRLEEMVNYFDYGYSPPTENDPISISTTLFECPWNSQHHLLQIGLQGKELPIKDLPSSNLVFLIDVSGSMNSPNKLPLVKSSMKLLVNQLREEDNVAIVTYAGHAGVILESVSASEKYKIMDAIDRLGAGGATAGAEGIKTAYRIAEENFKKDGNNRVILASDGDFNVGVQSLEGLKSLIEDKRKTGVYLSILGYGTGNYKDDIMQTLAQAGNGNHAYVDNLQEAQKVLVKEFGTTLFTIAKDVKLQIEFNPAQVAAYRLIGYETRMLEKEDFNNDKKDAGDMGSGHQVTAIYEIIPTGVKSDYIGYVDPLKYQQQKGIRLSNSKEYATIKIRYKAPQSDRSEMVESVIEHLTDARSIDDEVMFATAVAAFGMKLKESDYLEDFGYDDIISLAKASKGNDEDGYRAEFLRLVESSKDLSITYSAHK